MKDLPDDQAAFSRLFHFIWLEPRPTVPRFSRLFFLRALRVALDDRFCLRLPRIGPSLLPRVSARSRSVARFLGALTASLICMAAGCAGPEGQEALFPAAGWRMYAAPEEAGWSSDGISTAKAIYDTSGSDAFLAVFDGAVLVSWGDVSRRYMCHSVRKSYLSALYGVYAAEGRIDLDKTLGELGIDDDPPLTEREKRARVRHLLKSRSGVYHAAAYETPKMKERRPKRGSKEPGEFWYYNNWDFNALCTIFERETGTGVFEAFKSRIADPVGMEDFRLMDAYHHLESQHSIHPAYPFRMSARDMARFGLLFLRDGRWRDREIIPEDWVKASRRAYTEETTWDGFGYGYMWWVDVDESDPKLGMYAASGYGGHMIAVLPEQDLVFVNRTNTYLGETTQRADLLRLIDAVLEARVSSPKADPELLPLKTREDERGAHERPGAGPDFGGRLEDYVASFEFEGEEVFVETIPYVIGDMIGGSVRIKVREGRPHMTDDLGQEFLLTPLSKTEFLIEDMEIPVVFELDDGGRPVEITLDGGPAWRVFGRRSWE